MPRPKRRDRLSGSAASKEGGRFKVPGGLGCGGFMCFVITQQLSRKFNPHYSTYERRGQLDAHRISALRQLGIFSPSVHPTVESCRNASRNISKTMTTFSKNKSCQMSRAALLLVLGAGLAFSGCGRNAGTPPSESSVRTRIVPDPLAIALAPHAGESPLDERIRRSQEKVRESKNTSVGIEQLGWLFVAKARASFDAGFYTLAEQCALALDSRQPGCAESLLLRGHALQSQHRFSEAESIARQLVTKRGLAFDHGLLGDILADVGRVDEAALAYQVMIDLKPDLQGYARVAHVRWIKGDLDGAVEAMQVAADGASPHDAESAAWMNTQLARYLWQSGKSNEADGALDSALGFQTNYAPGLLLRGRMLLAAAKVEDAIPLLRQAAQINPLPEYHWALAEALRTAHREDEAVAVEMQLVAKGQVTDPRTCSLYLATRRTNGELAVRLARQELAERADVFTHDALAWALSAAGKVDEAQSHLQLALAQGTQEARLAFHATVITAQAGKLDEARAWFEKTGALKFQLHPSEQAELQSTEKVLSRSLAARLAPANSAASKSFSSAAGSGAATEN